MIDGMISGFNALVDTLPLLLSPAVFFAVVVAMILSVLVAFGVIATVCLLAVFEIIPALMRILFDIIAWAEDEREAAKDRRSKQKGKHG